MSRVLCAIRMQDPARPALNDLTYGALAGAVDRLAADLCEWIGTDPRPVAVEAANSAAWAVLDLALLSLHLTSLPLPGFFTQDQRRHALADAGAGWLITDRAETGGEELRVGGEQLYLVRLDHGAVALPAGTAKITYTSGTTGTPKGVCLSADGLEQVAHSLVQVIGADYAGRHVAILPLPVLLENVAGLYCTLLAGGHYLAEAPSDLGLDQPFQPDFGRLLAVLALRRANSVILVPELLRGLMAALVQAGRTLPDLRLVAVGGARVAPALLAQAAMLGLPVYQGYGLSECGSVVALNTPAANRVGSVGRVLPHLTLGVDDKTGEVSLNNHAFLGYVGGGPAPARIATADLGSVDGDGFLSIQGRSRNVIINAFGRNIAPEWVEAELTAQPEVLQAVLFGDGQADLTALVVPSRFGQNPASLSLAIARANGALPPYARIARWHAVPAFTPMNGQLTPNGRPRRDAIAAAHAPLLSRQEDEQPMPQSFFDRLVTETEPSRLALLSVPQIQDGLTGRISLDTYIAYLTEAYHHVKHTVPLMRTALAHLRPDQEWLVPALDEYIEEEEGHEEWILNDIRHAGGDAEGARHGTPRPATQAMVDEAYRFIREENAAGFFGMVYVLEGTSTAIATHGADAVRKSLNLPKSCFSYLTSHGSLDIQHMEFFRDLMNRVTDGRDQQAIITMANSVFRLFADLFRAIPHATPSEVRHVA
ncbi:AMP-binding protein [Niveispirillum sp.]|uniref:AMP-binding protein n=1 Tax=Niveispirillum sp. TaxID=1917217 RepID=UPI001B54F671|nr:AMP-binding protein [Niveispirillum sp.]MBP7337003.1 AMP-binding protein [Niveispirillum sp.]